MKLFEPIKIGSLEIKNRIVMPAINLSWSEDGLINERVVNFYKARAEGGVGLITIGGAGPSKEAVWGPRMLQAHTDDCIKGFEKINQILHLSGAKTSLQLLHGGRCAVPFFNKGKTPVSASEVPSPVFGPITPHALTASEIKDIINDFGKAAQRGKEGGFDTIEVHAGSSFLVEQFLSPSCNKRNDDYGGNLKNRLRFALEIIEAIRRNIGRDMPLVFRISADEINPDGYNLEDGIKIAQELEKNGVDALSVMAGTFESKIRPISILVPEGSYSYMFREISNTVRIPVIAGTRLHNILNAEELLLTRQADLISWGRPLIADPDLPRKILDEKSDDILPCVSCCICFDEVASLKPLTCMMNPLVGQEGKIIKDKIDKIKKIVVIGAGPAGITAALTAAKKGHSVFLYEAEKEVGGNLKFLSVLPGRGEYQKALLYFKKQLEKSKVKVILESKINQKMLLDLEPDSVIIATGSTPIIPSIPGIENKCVITVEDLLKHNLVPGENVVVLGGNLVGCEIALAIAKRAAISSEAGLFLIQHDIINCDEAKKYSLGNRHVVIIESSSKIGKGFGKTDRWMFQKEIELAKIESITNSEAQRIEKNGVFILVKGKEQVRISADTVIISYGYNSNKGDFEGIECGDASEHRGIRDAIKDGFEIGSNI